MNYVIEIATADFYTTKMAVEGGADRVELCADLYEGGTTPSYGTVRKCREAFDIELFPIIRCRGGDFCYTEEEVEAMYHDALLCKNLGCNGVVIGFLKKDGSIDVERTAQFVEAVYPLEVSFHRAFDRCKDPFEAMEQLIQIGCQRILTSGQKPAATEGMNLIAQLIKAANERIIIMPGSGIRPDNIKLVAAETGAVEFHSSLRTKRKGGMNFLHPFFPEEDFYNPAINPNEVKALRKALRNT